MKAANQVRGHVDGVWWPRSRSLDAEIPPLIDVLRRSHDYPVDRISYDLDEWDPLQGKVFVDQRPLTMEGYHTVFAHTIGILSIDGLSRTRLLVVPPEYSTAAAAHAVEATLTGRPDAEIRDLLDGSAARVDLHDRLDRV